MRIVICDDDNMYAQEVKLHIEELLDEKEVEAEIAVFNNSEKLHDFPGFYDVAFLDVEMSPYTGIQTARSLRTVNPYIVIFIITSHDKYLDDAMDMNVFRYIRKPLDIERLVRGMEKAISIINNQQVSVLLKNNEGRINILSDDIAYIEINGRGTTVITVNDTYLSENKIDHWEERLPSSSFCRVHKSYIVNLKHVSNYARDTVTLLNKYDIPIAYRKQAEFRKHFFDYFGGH